MTTATNSLSQDADTLLREAIAATRRSLALGDQAERVRPQFDALTEAAAEADEDLRWAEPGERRSASKRSRHVASQQTALRRREIHPEQLEDKSRWVLDDTLEALHKLTKRGSTLLPETLRRQLATAYSRCFQPHFESADATQPLERRLEQLIAFMEELLDAEKRADRDRLLTSVQALIDVRGNKLADPETSPSDGLTLVELSRRVEDWERYLEEQQEQRVRQSLGTLGFFPPAGTPLYRLQEQLDTAQQQEVQDWDAAAGQ